MEELIEDQLIMLNEGFSRSEVAETIWKRLLAKYMHSTRLDSIIFVAMEVYAEIIKRKTLQELEKN